MPSLPSFAVSGERRGVRIGRLVGAAACGTVASVVLLALHGMWSPTATVSTFAPVSTVHKAGIPAVTHHVVALGDSVPSGFNCSCDPFPVVYGRILSQQTGTPVTVENHGVGGLDTTGLLSQLKEPDVADAVRRSDVVLVTIGANDFSDHHDQVVAGNCSTTGGDCVSGELASLRVRFAQALATIKSLRQGQPTSVLVTGYWNVFQDGHVARQAYGDAGLQASLDLTRRVNATISSVSEQAHAQYVDIYEPFESRGLDIDALLAPDGDHPDAAGHALIARALLHAGLPGDSS